MKKVFLMLLFAILLSSCGALRTYDDKVKDLRLGMTQIEVSMILGRDYNVVNAYKTENVEVRVCQYRDTACSYLLYFENDILVEWAKEVSSPHYPCPPGAHPEKVGETTSSTKSESK